VNGTNATDPAYAERWSSIVALGNRGVRANDLNGQFCGGTLIAPTLVVTAAHCVTEADLVRTPRSITVFAGSRDLRAFPQALPVAAILPHPAYRSAKLPWDVAVLRLAAPAAPPAVPISLVQAAELGLWGAGSGFVGSAAAGPWIAGWGNTEWDQLDSPDYPNNLKEVQVPLHADATCRRTAAGGAPEFAAAHMVCAGTLDRDGVKATTDGKGTCPGDSGGPLIVSADGDGAPWRLVGVVSWGDAFNCAGPKFGFFSRIDAYRDWIQGIAADTAGPYGLQDPVAPVVVDRTVKTVSLAWAPPGGGPAPVKYRVYDYIEAPHDGVQLPAGESAGTSVQLRQLFPSTNYSFYVKAVFAGGESVGTRITARTLADRSAPSRPARVTAAPAKQAGRVLLRWRGSRDNHLVRRYAVFVAPAHGGGFRRLGRTSSRAPSFVVRGLTPGRRYRFRVQAVDFAANRSRLSAVAASRAR